VIYKIACKDCDASYVGQTKRQLKTRLREHKNNIRHDSKHTVVSEHIVNFNHAFNWENVQILDHDWIIITVDAGNYTVVEEIGLEYRFIDT